MFSFLLILKGTHHQSNCHEETRATARRKEQKEREKRGETAPTTERSKEAPENFERPYMF